MAVTLLWAMLPAPLLAQYQEGIKIQGLLLDAQTMQPLEGITVELVYRGALQDRVVTEARKQLRLQAP